MHHLESGDMVTFKEVKGMTSINGMTCRVEGEYIVGSVGRVGGWVGFGLRG